MWVYQIQEVKTEKKTGETYVLVHFWPDRVAFTANPPVIIEDFVMQLRPTTRRATTDAEGKTLRESGVWASHRAPPDPDDPPVYITEPRDVEAEIKGNIERFLKRNRPRRGDFTTIKLTDTSDPHGILADPDVASLPGKDFDEPGVSP